MQWINESADAIIQNAQDRDVSRLRHICTTVLARTRRGAISKAVLVMLASVAVLALLLYALTRPNPPAAESARIGQKLPSDSIRREPLLVYCAASNKGVIEKIRSDYASDCGEDVQVQYGASQSLLTSIDVSKTGDIYIPADSTYLKLARDRQLLLDERPIAEMKVVVAVQKGNPKEIKSLADLLRPGIRLAQGNPDTSAIGSLTRSTLTASNQWESLKERTIVFKTTVNDVANDIRVSAVDAGIVYDVTLRDYEGLDAVVILELSEIRAHIAVGVLACSRQPEAALRFVRYLSARDKGLRRYAEWGFSVVPGPKWSDEISPTERASITKPDSSVSGGKMAHE